MSTTTGAAGRDLIRRATSKPLTSASEASRMTRCGADASTRAIASRPECALPTTSSPGVLTSQEASPSRKSSFSSTRSTLHRATPAPPDRRAPDRICPVVAAKENRPEMSAQRVTGTLGEFLTSGGKIPSMSRGAPDRGMAEGRGGGGLFAGRHDAGADGEADQTRHVVDSQPLHQARAVGLDGLDAHLENMGDLLGGSPLGNQLENLALATGKALERLGFLGLAFAEKPLDHLPGDPWRKVGLTPHDRLQRERELGDRGPLEQVAGDAGPQGLSHVARIGMHREDQDASARGILAEPSGDLDAAEAGHPDVQKRDVGSVLHDQIQGLAAVS